MRSICAPVAAEGTVVRASLSVAAGVEPQYRSLRVSSMTPRPASTECTWNGPPEAATAPSIIVWKSFASDR